MRAKIDITSMDEEVMPNSAATNQYHHYLSSFTITAQSASLTELSSRQEAPAAQSPKKAKTQSIG